MTADPFPLGQLRYLYVGTRDVAASLAFWNEALGADLAWHFQAFGADVAGVGLGGEGGSQPTVLLADHRPAPSCLPIFTVRSVEAMAGWLEATSWAHVTRRVEVPDGPCLVVTDPSGNEIGLLQSVRPDALPTAYAARRTI